MTLQDLLTIVSIASVVISGLIGFLSALILLHVGKAGLKLKLELLDEMDERIARALQDLKP